MSNEQSVNEMSALVPRNAGEIDISANAAAAIAEVQAAYVMAMKNPRNIFEARNRMLESCERKKFSDKARYRRPVGKDRHGNQTYAEGFSVHFARPAAVMMRNILINTGVLYEDDHIRKVVARATDIEANVAYTKEAIVEKTIERKNAKGREVISQRPNSYGETVYLVVAYPHEVDLKAAKTTAILLRDCVLPLIPPDILEEVEEKIVAVMASELTSDPITARKNLVDAFKELNVSSKQLATYLKHSIEEITPQEYAELRAVYRTLKDGQAMWSDYEGEHPPVDLKPTQGREKFGFDKAPDAEDTAAGASALPEEIKPEGDLFGQNQPPQVSDSDRQSVVDSLVKCLAKKGVKQKARQDEAIASMCEAVGAANVPGIKSLDQYNAAVDWIAETWG